MFSRGHTYVRAKHKDLRFCSLPSLSSLCCNSKKCFQCYHNFQSISILVPTRPRDKEYVPLTAQLCNLDLLCRAYFSL